MPNPTQILVSMNMAAKMLHCSRNTFWATFVATGLVIPFYKPGKTRPEFFVADLEQIRFTERPAVVAQPANEMDLDALMNECYQLAGTC
jgi:hypothetical protein